MNRNDNLTQLRMLMNETRTPARKNRILEGIFANPEETDEPGYDTVGGMEEDDGAHEQLPQGMPDMKQTFANIRKAIISGIAMLANYPQSIEYDALKKMLTMIDKPLDTKGQNFEQNVQ